MRRGSWFGSRLATLVWLAMMVVVGGLLVFTSPGPSRVVFGQEDEVVDEVVDEAVDEEPADAAGGGGDAAPGADKDPTPATPRQSYLKIAWKALGWQYMLIFLGLSFTLVALLVMNLLTARRDNVCPVALVEGFEAHLDEKRYQEAYEMAKNDESFLGQVLSAGLAKLSSGYSQAIEAMQEVGEEENMKLEHRLSYMALIGTISPMVGLFGTVQGMISSFRVIAESTGTPQAFRAGRRYFDGSVHDAGRSGNRHSRHRGLQHPQEPHCPTRLGSRDHQ